MNHSTPFGEFPRDIPPQAQPPMPPFGTGNMPSFDTGGGWGERGSGWFRENASSVVLPIIALLVLGGGVYFYTRGRAAPERPIVEFENTTAQASPQPQETSGLMTETASPTPSPSPRIRLSPEGQPILGGPEETPEGPAVRLEGNAYKVRAEKGEGITHLARKAARDYLARTNPGYTVTREHKIYIEDFLKDAQVAKRTDTTRLALGEEISFSEELLKQAVGEARGLGDKDLKNLEQFSARVTNL